jgi:hypothetical protein
LYPFLISYMRYMSSPSHLPYDMWCRVQIMKLLTMQLCPSSLLGPNFLLNALCSHTLNPSSSLRVKDEFSHPYKTTGKIIVLNCLIVCLFSFINHAYERIIIFCTS